MKKFQGLRPLVLLAPICLLQIGLLKPSPSNAEPTEMATADAPPGQVERTAKQWMGQAQIPGLAIAGIAAGKVAWIGVYGERAPGQALRTDSVFNVASLTKPVFALMSLHLVADQRIELDQSLTEHWVDPDVKDDPLADQLTPRLLLSHQSGLPNWRGSKPLGFSFSPGARHEYSGEGYEYLRRAIESETGQSMPELMQRYVLAPLRLHSTWFGWNAEAEGMLARGYRSNAVPYTDDLKQRGPNAAANMLTSITDYATIAAWVSRGADLPKHLLQEMQTPQVPRQASGEHFGLGWRITKVGGETLLSHDGREPGVRTQVFVRPERRDGLVILTNSDNGELLTRPLVEASLSNSSALLNAVDSDVWNYLQHLPGSKVSGLAKMIASSPSFVSRLLHAANVSLLPAGDARASNATAIDEFVLAMLSGEVSPERAHDLVSLLIETRPDGAQWRQKMSEAELKQWATALAGRDTARTEQTALALADAVLDRYLGIYRVPSSNLPITISRGPSGIQATAPGMPNISLYAKSDTRFFMHEDNTQFEFVADPAGKVNGLRVIWASDRFELAPREP